jgi:hypothetical protein
MLYALWTIAGLLAMILVVLIVMRREYAQALSTLYSGLNQLCQTVEQNRIATEFELKRQTDKIVTELRDLKPDWKERRELIDAIEKIGADGTHVGDYLKWIASKIDDMENHALAISINTEREPPENGH